MAEELFRRWPGSWADVPEWPPGTLYADDEKPAEAHAAAPERWHVIIGTADVPDTVSTDVAVIELPPACARRDDLPAMLAAWVGQLSPGLGLCPEALQRLCRMAAEVGLEGLENRRPDQLSGGQQQRVAIARAIASNPAVVLADEPTANVDSETAEKLLGIMEKLNRNRGVTFVFSTHDPRVMERARRLVTLVDGRVSTDEKRE